jgi:hypothetical protein
MTHRSVALFVVKGFCILGVFPFLFGCTHKEPENNVGHQHGCISIPLAMSAQTGFMTFKAHLNGEEVLMVIDTAANETTFDMHLIDKLQLKTKDSNGVSKRAAGSLALKVANVKEFRAGSLSYSFNATFVDLTTPNEGRMTLGEPPIDGLLGMDFLLKWHAVIDCNTKTLIIHR